MSLAADLRAGYRSLTRAPAFAATAVATLALGIGLATAVYTVADAILIRQLPVVDQDRLVVLRGTAPNRGMDQFPTTVNGARQLAATSRALEGVASFLYNGATPATFTQDGDRTLRLQEALVSGNYFTVLGARATLGRTLLPQDDEPGAQPVMVLSQRAWQQHFGGDPSVVGRTIAQHDRGAQYTIVGVMPPGLDFPRGAESWSSVQRAFGPENAQYIALHILGRLTRDATPSAARDEFTALFQEDKANPFSRDVKGTVHALPQLIFGDMRPPVVAFAVAAALLLVITCVNVANLLLVRGLGRTREVAVRTALGARRGRVIMQLLAENSLLAVAGGTLGLVVAIAAVRAFVLLAPAGMPRLDTISVNAMVLLAASGITMLALLLFAMAPAILTSRVDVQEALRAGLRQGATRGSRLGREALVAVQVALAILVLSSAGLVTRSLLKLQGADLAFDPTQVTVAELSLSSASFQNVGERHAMLARVIDATSALPGVQDVSPVVSVPYASTRSWEGRPAAEEQSEEEASRNPFLDMEVVGPGFFATLGLPVVRGRGFSTSDIEGAERVVVLSESAARFYWKGADPIGRRLRVGTARNPELVTVIGIVPDARYRDLRNARSAIYYPLAQSRFPFAPSTLVIRASRSTADVTSALGTVLREHAPGVAVSTATSFESLLERPLAQPRMNALLLMVFATSAVALAGIGLFGVLATMVRQRRHELGIRMALGATAAAVSRLVVNRGLLLAVIGVVAGVAAALASNRWLADLLYETSPNDALTLVGGSGLVLLVAVLASLLPARASARIEPASALRGE